MDLSREIFYWGRAKTGAAPGHEAEDYAMYAFAAAAILEAASKV